VSLWRWRGSCRSVSQTWSSLRGRGGRSQSGLVEWKLSSAAPSDNRSFDVDVWLHWCAVTERNYRTRHATALCPPNCRQNDCSPRRCLSPLSSLTYGVIRSVLSVCLSVSRITAKAITRFHLNLQGVMIEPINRKNADEVMNPRHIGSDPTDIRINAVIRIRIMDHFWLRFWP